MSLNSALGSAGVGAFAFASTFAGALFAGAAFAEARASSTSALRMRLFGPVPETPSRPSPASPATFFASGEANIRSPDARETGAALAV